MAEPENVQTDITPHFKEVWDRGLLGAGVTVAVPDTGAGDTARAFAAELAKQGRRDLPFGQLETVAVPGAPSGAGDNGAHADQVIRRVLMVAPAARIVDLPVFRGTPSREVIIRAMNIAHERDADVLNMSLGEKVLVAQMERHYDECPVGRHAELMVTDRDIVVVAAIGNFRTEQAVACPGLAPGIIAVGAQLSPEESAWYRKYPHKAQEDFLEGRAGTSYSTALQSGTLALFRSAFPGIAAAAWNGIVFAATSSIFSRAAPTPLGFFDHLLEICGGDYVNSVQWRELRTHGITKRRELLAAKKLKGTGIADLPDLITLQKARAQKFAAGARAFAEGRDLMDDPDTLTPAIQKLRTAAINFGELRLSTMAASALLRVGAGLVFRAATPPGSVNISDVMEADKTLTEALGLVADSKEPDEIALLGAILSWRARANTYRAEVEPGSNAAALTDAWRAVQVLSALPASSVIAKDLAHAHLHLARANFFKAAHAGWLGRGRALRSARAHAATALELAGASDPYTKSEGEWLVEQSG